MHGLTHPWRRLLTVRSIRKFQTLILLASCWLGCRQSDAMIFASTGDPAFNTTAPDGVYAGSGWELQGAWNGFLATPIAPNFFIAAAHIGGSVGGRFSFQGSSYLTDASSTITGTDLRLWHVTSEFPTYAPIYRGDTEVGKEVVVFGTGVPRGADVIVAGGLHGWLWGPGDGARRWGTNTVASTVTVPGVGPLLSATFNLGASVNEAHLGNGDSSGGVFIKDTDGIWKLAGINYGVDGPYYTSVLGEGGFNAAIFDQTGLFEKSGSVYLPVTGPGSFYASRISANAAAIDAITSVPEPTAVMILAGAGILLCGSSRRR